MILSSIWKLLSQTPDYFGMKGYVYILKSISFPSKTYIGVTTNLRRRLTQHNAGNSQFTMRFIPWRLHTYIAFSDLRKAKCFEKYLKQSGGWRFAKRRLI